MLRLRNVGLDRHMGRETAHILRRVDLLLPRSGLVLVTGPAGSGKTALLRLLAGLEPPSRGEIIADVPAPRKGAVSAAWRRQVGTAAEKLLLPDRDILDNAALSARTAGWTGPEGEERCAQVLAFFGLERLGSLYPGELSGEEGRVAALACALAREPEALLVDEPVDGMGAHTADQVLSLLRGEASRRLVVAFSRNAALFNGAEAMTLFLEEGELTVLRGDAGETDRGPQPPSRPAPSPLREALGNLTRRGNGALARVMGVLTVVLTVCLALGGIQGRWEQSVALQSQTLAAYPVVITREDVGAGDLNSLGDYLESEMDIRTVSLQRTYAVTPEIYSLSASGAVKKVSPEAATGTGTWTELPAGEDLQRAGYSLEAGRWPTAYDEAAVILDSQGNLDWACVDALGLSAEEAAAGVSYTGLLRLSYRVVLPTGVYAQSADGTWTWMGNDEAYMTAMVRDSLPLKIVGVLRASAGAGVGGAAYTPELTQWYNSAILQSELVKRQTADPSVDVLTNRPFDETAHATEPEAQREALKAYARSQQPGVQAALCQRVTGETVEEAAAQDRLLQALDAMGTEDLAALYAEIIEGSVSPGTLEDNLRSFGVLDAETVTGLRLYAATFADRVELTDLLSEYGGPLTYTDDAAGVMSTGAAMMEADRWFLPVCTMFLAMLGLLGVYLTARTPLAARRREAETLYALGMPGGVGAVLLWETTMLGFLGALGGGLLGMALTRVLNAALAGSAGWSLPWWQAASAVLVGTAAAVLAALPERG